MTFCRKLRAPECLNDFATPGLTNLLCGVVYLCAPPVLLGDPNGRGHGSQARVDALEAIWGGQECGVQGSLPDGTHGAYVPIVDAVGRHVPDA